MIFNILRTFVASREGKGNAEVRPPAYLEELRHKAGILIGVARLYR